MGCIAGQLVVLQVAPDPLVGIELGTVRRETVGLESGMVLQERQGLFRVVRPPSVPEDHDGSPSNVT